ncbi:glycosyltransferase [Nocardioides humi]|uniref:glycosyltransferase n=1 Tax=Nocardioides humi TaxID=449461 RepID=UPI00112E1396|nr:glycosyltransferase [Nocardioides humi]
MRGHFTELELLVESHGIDLADRHWAVPRHPQTVHRLEGHDDVTWMPRIYSRDLAGAWRNLRQAFALHRRLRPSRVVTTGAAQAVPHLLAAACHRTPITYVESVARLDGPSLTGRLAARLPRAQLLAPRAGWGGRWTEAADAFSAFVAAPLEPAPAVSSAVVALGGENFPFPRAVRQVESALRGVAITWQVGSTDLADGVVRNQWLSPSDLEDAMAASSVVITHGGAGSILTSLAAGRVPVVLPRTAEHGEACDDHQVRMTESLEQRGLAVMVHGDEQLDLEHVRRAASLQVSRLARLADPTELAPELVA